MNNIPSSQRRPLTQGKPVQHGDVTERVTDVPVRKDTPSTPRVLSPVQQASTRAKPETPRTVSVTAPGGSRLMTLGTLSLMAFVGSASGAGVPGPGPALEVPEVGGTPPEPESFFSFGQFLNYLWPSPAPARTPEPRGTAPESPQPVKPGAPTETKATPALPAGPLSQMAEALGRDGVKKFIVGEAHSDPKDCDKNGQVIRGRTGAENLDMNGQVITGLMRVDRTTVFREMNFAGMEQTVRSFEDECVMGARTKEVCTSTWEKNFDIVLPGRNTGRQGQREKALMHGAIQDARLTVRGLYYTDPQGQDLQRFIDDKTPFTVGSMGLAHATGVHRQHSVPNGYDDLCDVGYARVPGGYDHVTQSSVHGMYDGFRRSDDVADTALVVSERTFSETDRSRVLDESIPKDAPPSREICERFMQWRGFRSATVSTKGDRYVVFARQKHLDILEKFGKVTPVLPQHEQAQPKSGWGRHMKPQPPSSSGGHPQQPGDKDL